ncbi:MAG: pyruvate formate lyase family protein, partial [Calditrichia bacterium]
MKTLTAKPYISSERAVLLTRFYQSGETDKVSIPVARALAFKYILENKSLYIGENEVIVGERGPEPKATPTYPELCTHSLKDLDILANREKISFQVSKETRKVYQDEIIPFWKGRSIRDRIFSEMDKEWKEAYEAGVFTEFMEQRAPGHTVLDDKIYHKGLRDFQKEIQNHIQSLDFQADSEALAKREQLKAMDIAAEALIKFARRYAEKVANLARVEKDDHRREELQRISEICKWVPANAPRTFWEALQYYWFVHLGVITELNTWDSFNPGRLDQHLYPFYKREVEAGILTAESAKELLQAFWVKFNNQPAPPKVGVT